MLSLLLHSQQKLRTSDYVYIYMYICIIIENNFYLVKSLVNLAKRILRYRTARHCGNTSFLARVSVFRIRPNRLWCTWCVLLQRFGVVVGRRPSRHLPRRRPHVEHAALALQIAVLQLQHVQLQQSL